MILQFLKEGNMCVPRVGEFLKNVDLVNFMNKMFCDLIVELITKVTPQSRNLLQSHQLQF
jgi:hypothetical protein